MKPEVVFGLESAAWPALLLNAGGVVLRANAAAAATFGAALAGEAPALSAIWSPENSGAPEDFFARWEQSPAPAAELKFRTANGATTKFTAAICAFNRDGSKWYVLQLLPAAGTGARRARPTKPRPRRTRAARRSSRNWIARCNWRGRCRWISTTR